MNIIDAYAKFNNQFIIYVMGLPGCGKTHIAKKLRDAFNIKLLDQSDYYKKDYDDNVMLGNGINVTNWYTDKAFDFEKLNDDIKKNKNGVVVSGMSFPENKIINPDFYICLIISKQECMNRRLTMLEKNKNIDVDKNKDADNVDELKNNDIEIEKMIMNKLIYPYYMDNKDLAKNAKFFNSTDISIDTLFDYIWEHIIKSVQSFIDTFNEKHYNNWLKNNPNDPYTISVNNKSGTSVTGTTDITNVTNVTGATKRVVNYNEKKTPELLIDNTIENNTVENNTVENNAVVDDDIIGNDDIIEDGPIEIIDQPINYT